MMAYEGVDGQQRLHGVAGIAGAIALVLLIAVVNVANLLLARATVRPAARWRTHGIGCQPQTGCAPASHRSAVLSLLGGPHWDLLLAYIAVPSLSGVWPGTVATVEEVGINPGVLLFTFVVCVGSGLLFGLAPALKLRAHR